MCLIYNIKSFVADLFYPNRCPVCDKFIAYNELICKRCEAELEYLDSKHCLKCGKKNCICADTEVFYDRCFAFVKYAGAGKRGVLAMKDKYGLNFGRLFAQRAVSYLNENGLSDSIDIITAVPASRKKLRATGYNHADEYARFISKMLSKSFDGKLISKCDASLVQHELKASERADRAFSAYASAKRTNSVKGKTVLLCDDIITTGSTFNACAKVLKDEGAVKVICCAIASTELE